MPFFRYSATDGNGVESMGTVEAQSPDDARAQLANQGLTVGQLMKAPDMGAQATTKPAVHQPPLPAQTATRQATPAFRTPAVATQRQAPTRPTPDPTSKKPHDVVRSKPSSNKDRMLLFSQMSKQIKAGIGPAAALSDLKTRVPTHMSSSIEQASDAATNGQSISDTFERYPDLYPPSTVGMIRAGETGGFLDEACDLLADQAQNAHAFTRGFWWVGWTIGNALVMLPLVVLLSQGMVRAWQIIERQGEGSGWDVGLRALGSSMLRQLVWPVGPITVALYVALFFFYRHMRSYNMTKKRHALFLRWPAFAGRTRHECLAVFSWVMSKLSSAGISPKSSWELAAGSVPNLAVREKLENVGKALAGHEKLSDAVFKEKLFPPEYAPMIATAEQTGDIPKTFEQLAKVSKSEFDSAQLDAQSQSSSWRRLGCIVVSGIMMILLMYALYQQLVPMFLHGIE